MNRHLKFKGAFELTDPSSLQGFPTTERHFVITHKQCGNRERWGSCKGQLRYGRRQSCGRKLSEASASTAPNSSTRCQSPHFNKHSHFSQIGIKKRDSQIPRNSMHFLYISASELAACRTEMNQEAFDNIMSIFFSPFLLQHKHRLLRTAQKSAWGPFPFLQRKAAKKDSYSPPFNPYYLCCCPVIFHHFRLTLCLYFHWESVGSTKHRGKSLVLHQSCIINPLWSPAFNIARAASTSPRDRTRALNRSRWQETILSIVASLKPWTAVNKRSCRVLKDLKK